MKTLINISAVTSVYNQQDTIKQTIESVIAVGNSIDEYLLLDDCSTDGTLKILEDYAARYPFIKLLRNEKNMGAIYSFRRIFSESKGDYVLGIAGDDYLLPDGMKKLINYAKGTPGYGLYFGNYYVDMMDEGSRMIFSDYRISETGKCFSAQEIGNAIQGRGIQSCGILIDKRYISDPKIYLDDLRWIADTMATYIIAFRYGAGYVPDATVVIRVYEGNFSSQSGKWELQKVVLYKIMSFLKTQEYYDIYQQMVKYRLFLRDMPRLLLFTPSLWDIYTFKIIYDTIPANKVYNILYLLIPDRMEKVIKSFLKFLKKST